MFGFFDRLGVAQKLALLLAFAIAAAAILTMVLGLFDASLDEARSTGTMQERAATSSETQKRTEKANEAVNDLRTHPDMRREQCLRYSDAPQNC
jgi:hypothetical protein